MKNNHRFLTLTLGTFALTAALAGGCASSSSATQEEDKTNCMEPKPGTITSVNKVCAIMNDEPVDPAVAVAEWKGQKVGFCCAGCVPKWNKLTAAQKDVALAAATAAK